MHEFFSALGCVLGRLVLAVVSTGIGLALFVATAIPYGGGNKNIFWFSVLSCFFLMGWALLPLVRWSRLFAVVFASAWLALAYFVSQFGNAENKAWMLWPWGLATLGIGVCLISTPPRYYRQEDFQQDDGTSEIQSESEESGKV